MLKIINNLKPFFEDCYKKINVREYSRIMKISPPTASKLLSEFQDKGLLNFEKEKIYYNYYSNIYNQNFIDLSRIYWKEKLSLLIIELKKHYINPSIILFGSLGCASLFFFFCFALVTEVRLRSLRASVVDVQWILCAILTPMPSVRWGSLNILFHAYPPKITIMSPLIFFSFAS